MDVVILGSAYAALGLWARREGVAAGWIALVLLVAYPAAAWLHLDRRLALGEEERTSRPAIPVTHVWVRSRVRPYPVLVEVETALLMCVPILLLLLVDWHAYGAGTAALFYVVSGAYSWRRVRARLKVNAPQVAGP